MRETSYHAVIAEMTVRALWELQNLLDCIPDALWDRCYGGAPLWQHVYHTLHELDQWFINPRDTDFVEPPIHTPHLQELHIYPAVRLDRPAIDDYFYTIKAKLSIYLTSLHDEDLLQRPDNCEWTRPAADGETQLAHPAVQHAGGGGGPARCALRPLSMRGTFQ